MNRLAVSVLCFVLCFHAAIARAESVANPESGLDVVLAAEAGRIEIIRRACGAVAVVLDSSGTVGGSGVLISRDGLALSNFHVTQPAGVAMKCGLPDGVVYDAVIVGIDPTGDVSLIKLIGRDDFPCAELGDSDQLNLGDEVFVAGNPFMLASDLQPTVSYGMVSGIHRYQYPDGTLLEYTDCIQTDAAINPGNSGGPLFDSQGRLVGIVGRASFEKRGRVNVGVGYAISINQIKNFLGHLQGGRVVDHATLGATVSTDEEGRVVVDDILEESDAFRRGLRYDDQIVRFGGREIGTVNAFKNVLGIYPQGWRVPITFRRDGETTERLVRLSSLHAAGELDALLQRRPATPERGPEPPGPDEDPGKAPQRRPVRAASETAPAVPEAVKGHFEARPGYANYYFNRVQRERVWNAYAARGDFLTAGAPWTVHGYLERGGRVTIQLSQQAATILLPEGEWKTAFGEELDSSLAPPQSGGLLAALYVWQRLVSLGPARYGALDYLGTMPHRTQPGLFDILAGTCGGCETHFLFDPRTGDLVGLEAFVEDEADPCEVYFDDFRGVDGHMFPFRWEIYHGDVRYARIQVEQVELSESNASAM